MRYIIVPSPQARRGLGVGIGVNLTYFFALLDEFKEIKI
jgi:hypothetical protein